MAEPPLKISAPRDGAVDAVFLPDDKDSAAVFGTGAGSLSVPTGFTGQCILLARDHGPRRVSFGRDCRPYSASLPELVRLNLCAWTHSATNRILVRDHVANINWILNGHNPSGIVLDLTIKERPDLAWNQIGYTCSYIEILRKSTDYLEEHINVYYNPSSNPQPKSCPEGDIIFIPAGSGFGKLAHEIGHSLGVRGNSDGTDNYSDAHAETGPPPNPLTIYNVMWRFSHTLLRYHFTLGQIAWMHSSDRSVLSFLGKRGWTVDCSRTRCALWKDDSPCRRPSPGAPLSPISPFYQVLLSEHLSDEDLDRSLAELDIPVVGDNLSGTAVNGLGADPIVQTIKDALAERFDEIVRYWDNGNRPEGRPGSETCEAFVRLHLGETETKVRLEAARALYAQGDIDGLRAVDERLREKVLEPPDLIVLQAVEQWIARFTNSGHPPPVG